MLGHWVPACLRTRWAGQRSTPGRDVFTIKLAFQIREEQINIRSEDLIVVTESGAEILSDFAPFTVDQIEKQMTADGLLHNCGTIELHQELFESRHTLKNGNLGGVQLVA